MEKKDYKLIIRSNKGREIVPQTTWYNIEKDKMVYTMSIMMMTLSVHHKRMVGELYDAKSCELIDTIRVGC